MTRTIAVTSQKGGVAKTTTTANLAAVWGRGGQRVLCVDLDPQFALTRAFGCVPSHFAATTLEAMRDAIRSRTLRIGNEFIDGSGRNVLLTRW